MNDDINYVVSFGRKLMQIVIEGEGQVCNGAVFLGFFALTLVGFVEMFDYTCPHCRATHKAIHGAMERFGDDLAIVALPVPLNRACNSAVTSNHSKHAEACKIAKIAVALWRPATAV